MNNHNKKLLEQESTLYFLYFSFAISFIASLFLNFDYGFIIKPIPILVLSLIAWKKIPHFIGKVFAIALFFSAAGDLVLALKPKEYFVFGLTFFAITHILYIITFSQIWNFKKIQFVGVFIVVMYTFCFGYWILPSLGKLSVPVYIYIGIIATMGTFAIFSNAKTVICGCFFFIVSDSLLAVNKFIVPFEAAQYFIITTYYLGQFLIAIGIIVQMSRRDS